MRTTSITTQRGQMNQVPFSYYLTKSDRWWLIILLILAIVMRIPHLNGSFWLDEAAQALEITRPTSQQLLIENDFQPPLLHIILHLAQFISTQEWWLRLIGAFIPGIATILLLFEMGRRFYSKSTGIIASLFLATSSFHLFYSQELRPYSLSCLFTTWSFYLLFSALNSKKNDAKQKTKALHSCWIKIGLINLLGLYSTYLYPFVLIAQAVYLLVSYRLFFPKWLKPQLIPLGGFLLWLPSFLSQLQAGQLLRQTLPGWEQVVSTGQLKALPLILAKFIFGVLKLSELRWPILASVFLGICLLILTIQLFRSKKVIISINDKTVQTSIVLASLLLMPWLISFWVPIVQPKRLLIAQPFLYLIISWLISQAWSPKKHLTQFISVLTVLLILFINFFSSYSYYTKSSLQRENWRDLNTYLRARFPSNRSIALFAFEEPFAPWQWYDQNYFLTLTTGTNHLDDPEIIEQKIKMISEFDFVFVFDYLTDLSDPKGYLLQTVKDYGFQEIEVIDQPNIGFVHVFIRDNNRV